MKHNKISSIPNKLKPHYYKYLSLRKYTNRTCANTYCSQIWTWLKASIDTVKCVGTQTERWNTINSQSRSRSTCCCCYCWRCTAIMTEKERTSLYTHDVLVDRRRNAGYKTKKHRDLKGEKPSIEYWLTKTGYRAEFRLTVALLVLLVVDD